MNNKNKFFDNTSEDVLKMLGVNLKKVISNLQIPLAGYELLAEIREEGNLKSIEGTFGRDAIPLQKYHPWKSLEIHGGIKTEDDPNSKASDNIAASIKFVSDKRRKQKLNDKISKGCNCNNCLKGIIGDCNCTGICEDYDNINDYISMLRQKVKMYIPEIEKSKNTISSKWNTLKGIMNSYIKLRGLEDKNFDSGSVLMKDFTDYLWIKVFARKVRTGIQGMTR